MKYAVLLLVLLPLAYGNLLSSLGSFFHGAELKALVTELTEFAGSDMTEQLCEGKCKDLTKQQALLSTGCDMVCSSLQSLAKHFGVHPATTA